MQRGGAVSLSCIHVGFLRDQITNCSQVTSSAARAISLRCAPRLMAAMQDRTTMKQIPTSRLVISFPPQSRSELREKSGAVSLLLAFNPKHLKHADKEIPGGHG